MPIQFRCQHCNQKLAISRRKAGHSVNCPACARPIPVPSLEAARAAGQLIEPTEEPPPRQAPRPADVRPPAETPPPAAAQSVPASPPTETAPEQSPVAAEAPADAPPNLIVTGAIEAPSADGPPARRWSVEEDEDEEGFHLGRRPADESGLDMTPMVDVTFLLLIFFMITASFSIQKSMEAEPPEPEQEGAAQLPSMDDLADDSVVVELDENDAIFVDDAQVGSIGELTDVLARKISGEQKLEMVIEAHPLSKHGTVIQVTDAGIEVGMQRIRRVTRRGD